MLRSFKNFVFAVAVLAMGVSATVHAQTTPEQRAARHALNGPEIKKLKVAGHEFNVKKATISYYGQRTTIKGQLSHHLSFRPDDQVYYTIVKANGRVVSIDIKIDRGGLTPYVSKVASKLLGHPESDLVSIGQRLGQFIDGKWESAADLIIATIAIQAPSPDMGQAEVPRVTTDGNGGIVRDHRTPPVVRDHRAPPAIRDHRK